MLNKDSENSHRQKKSLYVYKSPKIFQMLFIHYIHKNQKTTKKSKTESKVIPVLGSFFLVYKYFVSLDPL
jgi:hypothetical protein